MAENTEIDLNETLKSDYASSPSAVIGKQKSRERYILTLFGIMQKNHYFTCYARKTYFHNGKLIGNYAFCCSIWF